MNNKESHLPVQFAPLLDIDFHPYAGEQGILKIEKNGRAYSGAFRAAHIQDKECFVWVDHFGVSPDKSDEQPVRHQPYRLNDPEKIISPSLPPEVLCIRFSDGVIVIARWADIQLQDLSDVLVELKKLLARA